MLTALSLSFALAFSAAPADVTVAVLELRGVGVPAEKASFATQHLADQMAVRGLKVVSPRTVADVLGMERQRQLLGCTDDQAASCTAELGNALGAEALVSGDLAHVEERFQFSLRAVSSSDGVPFATQSGQADSEGALLDALARAGRVLAAAVLARGGRADAAAQAVLPGPAPRDRAWIPLVLGGAVAAAGIGLWANSAALAEKLRTAPSLTGSEAVALRDTGAAQQTLGVVGVCLGTGALIAGGAMALFGGPKAAGTQVSVWAAPGAGGLVVGGALP